MGWQVPIHRSPVVSLRLNITSKELFWADAGKDVE